MFRGTTPILTFGVPFDTSIIKQCYITFSQNDDIVLEKGLVDVKLLDNAIVLPLSQEDTLLFDSKKRCVTIQLRVLTDKDMALASKPIKITIDKILKDGVISVGDSDNVSE